MCRLLILCTALLAGAQLLRAQPSAAVEDRAALVDADVVAVTSFVETFVANAVAILTDESLPPGERDEAFRAMLMEGFDTFGGARFVLGRGWRMATREQRDEFVALFRQELLRKAKELFEGYEVGEVLEVTRVLALGAGKFMVATELTNPEARINDVDFLVRKTGARLQIVDVRLEGFSLRETYRREFVPPLFQGGVERVLRRLRPREAF
jgi:ABC-type transporter MlaC component